MTSALQMVSYWFWELAVTLACLVAVRRIDSVPLKWVFVLAANVTLSALVAMLCSFAGWNSPSAYLSIAGVLALAAGWAASKDPASLRQRAGGAYLHLEVPALLFGLGLMLALVIRPIGEVDSLYNLHYVAGWIQNLTTPYQFAYNYVPFWELSYVPSLVLTESDRYLWFVSLKAVLLLAAALFLLARELALPIRLAAWTVASSILFPHLWIGPSGVATIKNDMIHAAGYALGILAAVRVVQGKRGRVEVALVALASIFVSVKFSGPVVLFVSGVMVAATAQTWIVSNVRSAAMVLSAIGLLWLPTTGHFYLRNYLVHGNPVYPYIVNLGLLQLPGRADQSATSILASLDDDRLWRYFFVPAGGVSPAGLLFPVILTLLLLGSLAITLAALWRRRLDVLAVLALFELAAWTIYFRSYYSASGSPGDLIFVASDLNSVRFAEGALLVGEVALVWVLYRAGVPQWALNSLLAIHAASLFWLVLHRTDDVSWLLLLLGGAVLALTVFAPPRSAGTAWMVIIVAIALAGGGALVERRREPWLAEYQSLYRPLYDSQRQDLFYLITDEFSQQPCWHFPFLGRRFQHPAYSGSLHELGLRKHRPEFVVWIRAGTEGPPELFGYRPATSSEKGIVFQRIDESRPSLH